MSFPFGAPGLYLLFLAGGTFHQLFSSALTVTFLCYWEDAMPQGVYPRAVLNCPNKVAGGPPIRVESFLKQRC
jgi:hypothetical protein